MIYSIQIFLCMLVLTSLNGFKLSDHKNLPMIMSRSLKKNLHSQRNGMEFLSTITPSDYVYVPPDVTWEIYVGSTVAVMPIIWGAFEFWKRIETQKACLLCKGDNSISNF